MTVPPDLAQGRRVAIIHYWLIGMRGGEKVLETLCRMFPNADLFTHVANPSALSPTITAHKITQTRIAKLPFARRLYQAYLPLMPRALEELDLSRYDLIISSEAGPAKGIIPPPGVPHLSYCHSPMRYIWDQYSTYYQNAGWLARQVMPRSAHRLRQWDVTSAARVDGIVANSSFVAKRIKSYWRRTAQIVPPPVDIKAFGPAPQAEIGDHYLWLGEMTPYKRPDLAIAAFEASGRPLTIIGGPQQAAQQLRKKVAPNIRILGHRPFSDIKDHLARCRALIFPGLEDFGIVPIEAMASGRPVIAYGAGGALDSVLHGQTGHLFSHQSVESLNSAIDTFEASGLAASCMPDCLAQASRFSETNFVHGLVENLNQIGAEITVGDAWPQPRQSPQPKPAPKPYRSASPKPTTPQTTEPA
jgi:glycosyltransferase involved in cell wall biosynthesis